MAKKFLPRDEDKTAVACFRAEAESMLYMQPTLLLPEQTRFKRFHDFTIACGQPMATVLVSAKDHCRNCNKNLVVENKTHPVVIYTWHRGTYLGCRVTKQCRKCKIYEHYGYWTVNGEKHYDNTAFELQYLQSSEDTAFEMNLLQEFSNLLIIGAVPFKTYASSYNRRFGYVQATTNGEHEQTTKRMKR